MIFSLYKRVFIINTPTLSIFKVKKILLRLKENSVGMGDKKDEEDSSGPHYVEKTARCGENFGSPRARGFRLTSPAGAFAVQRHRLGGRRLQALTR